MPEYTVGDLLNADVTHNMYVIGRGGGRPKANGKTLFRNGRKIQNDYVCDDHSYQ